MELIGLIFALIVGVVCLQRVRWRGQNRGDKQGRYRGGAALGNALQAIQAFAQPHVKHVIEQRVDEAAEEEDDEASQDPKAYLLRQAKRIRNGEEIDRLTALLPPK